MHFANQRMVRQAHHERMRNDFAQALVISSGGIDSRLNGYYDLRR